MRVGAVSARFSGPYSRAFARGMMLRRRLLACLAARPGTVLTRETLLAEVWGWADASGTRTVDSHVRSLRRKLGSHLLRTVHGVGYALEPGR